MERRCDYCGIEQALVLCTSDSAKLCLNCDVCVHSANTISLRHTRSLLCEKCLLQPALIHCLNDKVSLCQECHWMIASNCSGLGHRFQSLHPYSGCPSPLDFANMWSSILEPSVSTWGSPFDDCTKIKEVKDLDAFSTSPVTEKEHCSYFSMESNIPKMIEKESLESDLCELINLEDTPIHHKGFSSIGHTKCYQYNEDSFKEENNIGINSLFLPATSENIVPSLSISMSNNITGESISPGIGLGDMLWESNCEVSFSPKARDEAKKRYEQKKSRRMFGKQIRYASRKARADTRKRVKGRFVKSEETF